MKPPNGSIPIGIERVLMQAAGDPRFAQAIQADRVGALEACGIDLTASEQAILDSLAAPLLTEMISGLSRNLVDQQRRTFLGRSTAMAALLLGGSALSGCSRSTAQAKKQNNKPAVPTHEEDKHKAKHGSSREDVREIQQRQMLERLRERSVGTLGIRPDRPPQDHVPDLIGRGAPYVDAEHAFTGISGTLVEKKRDLKKK